MPRLIYLYRCISIMPTADRPRLQPETSSLLEDIKKELEFKKEEEKSDTEKYEGRTSQIAKDRIIREGLKALDQRGYEL